MCKNIVIIGSGWLGWPLAQHLSTQGHRIIATTTSQQKADQLNSSAVQVIKLLGNNAVQPETLSVLANYHIMVIAIPPGRQQTDYLQQLQQLLSLAEQANIANVLFISSSSVYGKLTGTITERILSAPGTPSAIAMAEFEQLLLRSTRSHNSVLRLAGLIGPARHPGRFLANKINLANPDSVVNMIHQHDCIGLIDSIITQNSWHNVYIGCAPSHPSRREFYQLAANKLSLTPPCFIGSGGKDAKLIDGQHTATILNYQYKYPDLMAWLEQTADESKLSGLTP